MSFSRPFQSLFRGQNTEGNTRTPNTPEIQMGSEGEALADSPDPAPTTNESVGGVGRISQRKDR